MASGNISLTEMRFLIAVLALAGVVVSALALRVHYDTGTEPCSINEKWDCGIVNHSPFAEVAHVPVAAIGIAGYLTLAGLALARRRAWLAGLAVIGLGFALYLSNIERSVLEVWCLYCVISQGIIALVTLLSFGWLGAAQWSRRRTQSPRPRTQSRG
jgi:vitamin-K-epoxide reductase (warfarin-sensitive)